MGDIRRGVDPTDFPPHGVVVQVRFSDAPSGRRDWWLVSEGGATGLCMKDPGHEVNVVVLSSLRALTEVGLCRWHHRRGRATAQPVQVLGSEHFRRHCLPARLGEVSLQELPIES